MSGKDEKRAVLLVVTLGAFITPFLSSSVNIALPAISREFGMNAVTIGWVSTSYLLAAAVFLVPFGRIADIHGRKKVFLYGVLLTTLSSLLCGLAWSEAFLIVFRILQGFGSSMMFGTGVAILTSVFPATERGKALGINIASTYLGLSLGPVLGGLLTQHFSWRSIFFFNVPLGLVIIAAVLVKLKDEWAEAQQERFRVTDSIFYGLALLGIMYGFLLLPGLLGGFLIAIGIFGFIGFALFEARTKSPILDMAMFRSNRTFIFSSLAALINYSATFAVSFLLSLYLQYIKGFDPRTAGLVLVIQPAFQALLSPFSGRLSDKVEPRKVASAGMLLTAVGLFLLIFLNEKTHIIFIGAALMMLGIGFAFFSSPNTNAVMGSVDKRFYGVASGVLGTMRLVGQVFSMGTATLVFALHIGRVSITLQYYGRFIESSRIIFIILTVLCVAGIFASLARKKRTVESV